MWMLDILGRPKRETLCGRCVRELQAEGVKLRSVERAVDQKVTCDRCGKRRYGGVYERQK